jgi:hypothetical protein
MDTQYAFSQVLQLSQKISKNRYMHQNYVTCTLHTFLVSRVEFIEAILSPAVQSACSRDSVTILQYTQTLDGYNVPFCGLIQGMSSKFRSHFPHLQGAKNWSSTTPRYVLTETLHSFAPTATKSAHDIHVQYSQCQLS